MKSFIQYYHQKIESKSDKIYIFYIYTAYIYIRYTYVLNYIFFLLLKLLFCVDHSSGVSGVGHLIFITIHN